MCVLPILLSKNQSLPIFLFPCDVDCGVRCFSFAVGLHVLETSFGTFLHILCISKRPTKKNDLTNSFYESVRVFSFFLFFLFFLSLFLSLSSSLFFRITCSLSYFTTIKNVVFLTMTFSSHWVVSYFSLTEPGFPPLAKRTMQVTDSKKSSRMLVFTVTDRFILENCTTKAPNDQNIGM